MKRKTLFRLMVLFGIIFSLAGLALISYEVYFILSNKPEDMTNNIYFACGGAVLLILGIIFYSSGKKMIKKNCQKCAKSLNGCAYEWVLEQLYNTYAPDNSFANQIAAYKITAICPHCGKENVYHQDFIATDYRTGTQNNTQRLIEDWCKQKFGH